MAQSPEKKQRVRIKVAELQARDAHIIELRRQLKAAKDEGAEMHRKSIQWLMLAVWLNGQESEDGDGRTRELVISKHEFDNVLPSIEITRVPTKDNNVAAIFRTRLLTEEEVAQSVEDAKARLKAEKEKKDDRPESDTIIIPN